MGHSSRNPLRDPCGVAGTSVGQVPIAAACRRYHRLIPVLSAVDVPGCRADRATPEIGSCRPRRPSRGRPSRSSPMAAVTRDAVMPVLSGAPRPEPQHSTGLPATAVSDLVGEFPRKRKRENHEFRGAVQKVPRRVLQPRTGHVLDRFGLGLGGGGGGGREGRDVCARHQAVTAPGTGPDRGRPGAVPGGAGRPRGPGCRPRIPRAAPEITEAPSQRLAVDASTLFLPTAVGRNTTHMPNEFRAMVLPDRLNRGR